MQPSCVAKTTRWIVTFSHESGAQPSLLGPAHSTRTSRTTMFRLSTGWMFQNGELRRVTPEIRTRKRPGGPRSLYCPEGAPGPAGPGR